MGICCVIVRLRDETIDELTAAPRKIWHFFSPDDMPEPPPVSLLARMLGFKAEPYPECSARREEGDYVDLDKSWKRIDQLLSSGGKKGDICHLLTMKGEPIGQEVGYGRPQAFRSPLVRDFHQLLDATPAENLRGRFEGDGTELENYIMPNYENLRSFISDTAKLGRGVIVFNI